MKLMEIRSNPALLEEVRKIYAMPGWAMIRSMLNDEQPSNYPKHFGQDWHAVMEMGRVYGYDNALSNLDAAALPMPKQMEDVPASWNASSEDGYNQINTNGQ